MAETPKKNDQPAAAAADANPAARQRMGVRLAAVDNSDQPVLANYTVISPAPGMAFIDFGFLEPAMLAAIPRLARQGGKLPEAVNGKLAVRVAMGYDAIAGLHQQLGRVLGALRSAGATEKPRTKAS